MTKAKRYVAPKGNKFGKGHGRPLVHLDVEDIPALAEEMEGWFRKKFDTFRKEVKRHLQPKEGDPAHRPMVDLPTFDEFAFEKKIPVRTLYDYRARGEVKEGEEPHKDFEYYKSLSQAWETCRALQGRYITMAGMNKVSDSRFSIFAAMNYSDMRQKNELSGADGGPITVSGVDIKIQD